MIRRNDIRRLGSAVAGTAAVAAVNFLASLLLLREGNAGQFGVFAFMQISIALGYGISNAIFGAPLVLIIHGNGMDRQAYERSFALVNVLACVGGAAMLTVCGLFLHDSVAIASLFGLHAFVHWIRWYQRSYGNAIQRNESVAKMDVLYGIVTAIGLAGMVAAGRTSMGAILVVQCAAALVAWLAADSMLRYAGVRGAAAGTLSPFGEQFKQHGRHSLVGVLTTEGMSNGHAYIVTSLLGPAAFAPIAAALLVFRPVALIVTVLTQVERPRLAQAISEGRHAAILQLMKLFCAVAVACWVGNALLAGLLLPMMERLEDTRYASEAVGTSVVLCALIFLMRCVRAPAGAYMQASGAFRLLTRATIGSSLVALPLVVLLCMWSNAQWSLLGTLIGELVAMLAIGAFAARALQARADGSPA